MLVAVEAYHLFRDILIALHVLAVSGNLEAQRIALKLRLHLEICEDAAHCLSRHLDAEHAVHAGQAHRERALLNAVARILACALIRDGACTEFFGQMQGAFHRELHRVLVRALLKVRARIGALPERAGAAADVVARKLCRLEDDRARRILNLRIEAAHDARKADRLLTVAN